MSRDSDLNWILDQGIVAIIRASSGEALGDASRALAAGGIDVIEVTFTVPNVLDVLAQLHRDLKDRILLGAGTVLDPESARAALLAGAEFLVTPTVNPDVIEMCRRYGKVCICGGWTPTEVLSAWQAGADIVKLFPAEVGGPGYLKALRGPFPQVRLLPTGGVNLETLPKFFAAGACAVGLGSALVEQEALERGDMAHIQSRAASYVDAVRRCRNHP